MFERGEEGGVAAKSFCQLVKPDRQNPTYIIGMEPPALTQDTPFRSNTQLKFSNGACVMHTRAILKTDWTG